MKNKTELSAAEVTTYKTMLTGMQKGFRGQDVQEEIEAIADAARLTADETEASSLQEYSEVLTELHEHDEIKRYQVQEALDRIADGTYGLCVECTNAIPKARLNVLPHTPHCINCQRNVEAGQKTAWEQVVALLDNEAA